MSRLLAVLLALSLVAAACGDDDDGGDDGGADTDTEQTDEGTTEETPDEGATDETDEGATDETDEGSTEGGGSADLGPIKVGMINSEDLFFDYSNGAGAAAALINGEYGGLDGREIEFEVCAIDYGSPDDTQRCANELAANGTEISLSGLNQFGTHFEILNGAGIPTIVGSAVSIPDYTSPGVYAIAAGGGCPGTLTAMTVHAVRDLGGTNVAVPFYDIPSGALCNSDNEAKVLDILRGDLPEATSELSGTAPDLTYTNVPLPTEGDLTPGATDILASEPDVIIYSGPAEHCWNLVNALASLGWTNADIPMVMTSSCWDPALAADAGEAALGMRIVGQSGFMALPLDTLEGEQAEQAATYQETALEYGLDPENVGRSFAQSGFTMMMSMWQRATEIAAAGGQVTGQSLGEAFAATSNAPNFGSTPVSCADAQPPYISLCNVTVDISEWDGTNLVPISEGANEMGVLAGTEIRTPE